MASYSQPRIGQIFKGKTPYATPVEAGIQPLTAGFRLILSIFLHSKEEEALQTNLQLCRVKEVKRY
jgi:hypothetical protein